MIRMHYLIAALLVLISATVQARENTFDNTLPLWQLDGIDNKIFLLGSIHVLRKQDHPLPERFDAVFEEAETIIMELDMDDVDPIATQREVLELGMIHDGGTLESLMGPEFYRQAKANADAANIDLAMLAQSEPWYAAITTELLSVMRLGFNPRYGIEMYITGKAKAQKKEILGLETNRQQLEFFDELSLEAQSRYLIQSLSDAAGAKEAMGEIIDAWRHGDIEFLEDNLLSTLQKFPEVYEALLKRRNQAWIEPIEALLNADDDYLIVVGAAHLIGEDSVLALLEQRGISATQLRQKRLR